MNKYISIYLRTCVIALFCISLLFYFEPELPQISEIQDPNKHVWLRYIAHFGNLNTDGKWINWKIKRGGWTDQYFDPPLSIPSVFFPQLGLYSSHNRQTIKKHLKIITNAHISALIVDWNGPNRRESEDSDSNFIDTSFQLIIELAKQFEIQIGIFMTDYYQRTTESLLDDIKYYLKTYSNQSTCLKFNNKPVVFVNNNIASYVIDQYSQFVSFFTYGTSLQDIFDSYEKGYVGFTTYSPGNQYSQFDNQSEWKPLSNLLRSRNISFVPSIKPGINMSAYNIQLSDKSRSRNNGLYYDSQWEAAIGSGAEIILINSFNNWIEGTVIEPVEHNSRFPLNNDIWAGTDPNYFMDSTGKWIQNFTLFK